MNERERRRQHRAETRRRDLKYKVLYALIFVVALVVLIVVASQGVDCMTHGGTFVRGLPWYTCVGATP